MVDITDTATDYEEIARSAAIATACTIANDPIPTSKKCLNCGAKTKGGARWCDADCQIDWGKRYYVK